MEKQKNNPTSPLKTAKNPTSRALIVVSSILGVALLALTFFGGVAIGRKSTGKMLEHQELIRRQLTENLDKPIRERPLLKNLSENIKKEFNKNGLIGKIVEIEDNALVVETKEGVRSVLINEETKILEGKSKEERSLSDLSLSDEVHILGQEEDANNEGPLTAKVIISTNGERPPRPGGPRP